MKYTLLTVLALSSFSALAIDLRSMMEHAGKQTVFHPDCVIFYAPTEDKQANKNIEKLLSEKGYDVKNNKKEIKDFKGGLGYALAGKEGKEKKREKHEIKNCEKLSGALSLDIEAGWRDDEIAFSEIQIARLEKVDCQKRSVEESLNSEILRRVSSEFKKPELAEGQTLETALSPLLAKSIDEAFVKIPNCVKREDITFDVSPETSPLAPPPECEDGPGCYDGQRYSNTKELNEIETRRIQRLNGASAQ
jgi:hypothetical protein